MRRVMAFALLACLGSASALQAVESGLQPGETVMSFSPRHVAGPFKDLDVCTTCRFGMAVVIQVWVNKDDAATIAAFAQKLDAFTQANPDIKCCMIASSEDRKKDIEKLTTEEVPVSYLPYGQERVAGLFKINTDTKNTIHLYMNKKVQLNSVNVDVAGLDKIFDAAKVLQASKPAPVPKPPEADRVEHANK